MPRFNLTGGLAIVGLLISRTGFADPAGGAREPVSHRVIAIGSVDWR
jgi:hypothetical protein